jgi:hypothetical protein
MQLCCAKRDLLPGPRSQLPTAYRLLHTLPVDCPDRHVLVTRNPVGPRSSRPGHSGHAAVPGGQAAAPRRHRLLSDGRLLRDVLRGCPGRVARARPDAHLAQQGRRRRRHPDVRRAVSRGGRVPGAPREEGVPGGDLRAGRRPEEGEGAGAPRGRPRGVAGHVHRRGLPRRPRARLSDGARPRLRT